MNWHPDGREDSPNISKVVLTLVVGVMLVSLVLSMLLGMLP